MSYKFYEFEVSDFMVSELEDYFRNGTVLGGFLTAVLTNDLRGACERADSENLRNLPAFVAYLYNNAPSDCWGSKAKVEAWQERNGLSGPIFDVDGVRYPLDLMIEANIDAPEFCYWARSAKRYEKFPGVIGCVRVA